MPLSGYIRQLRKIRKFKVYLKAYWLYNCTISGKNLQCYESGNTNHRQMLVEFFSIFRKPRLWNFITKLSAQQYHKSLELTGKIPNLSPFPFPPFPDFCKKSIVRDLHMVSISVKYKVGAQSFAPLQISVPHLLGNRYIGGDS
ncbi:hypothetical protein NIES25_10170 [Nostoc linckia NIES-25]|nr:hypothetical protein NIES25_10170 [Nostoc linckia NIES-25]